MQDRTQQQARELVGLVREGYGFTGSIVKMHTDDKHFGRFDTCRRCDAVVAVAFDIDETLDNALIAEVGIERVMEIAAEEGVQL